MHATVSARVLTQCPTGGVGRTAADVARRNGVGWPVSTLLLLGIGLAALVLWQWTRASRGNVPWRAHVAIDGLTAMTLLQVGLGIATLLTHVAMPLAILHQLGALVVFTLALWMVYELGPPD